MLPSDKLCMINPWKKALHTPSQWLCLNRATLHYFDIAQRRNGVTSLKVTGMVKDKVYTDIQIVLWMNEGSVWMEQNSTILRSLKRGKESVPNTRLKKDTESAKDKVYIELKPVLWMQFLTQERISVINVEIVQMKAGRKRQHTHKHWCPNTNGRCVPILWISIVNVHHSWASSG
jgi:hypothetical protein